MDRCEGCNCCTGIELVKEPGGKRWWMVCRLCKEYLLKNGWLA